MSKIIELDGSVPNVCNYCGNKVSPALLKWRVYQPTRSGPVETFVCGRCFILIDILRVLKEIQHGRLGQPKVQIADGDGE